jgi:hypothetical protein
VAQGAILVARSTDGGKTFGHNTSVLSDQELQRMISRGMTPSLGGDKVSAGLAGLPPTRVVPQEVRVVTTDDSGVTWSEPARFGDEQVAHITNRPWIAYTSVQQGRNGPTGVLAVLWRNAYPPYNPSSGLVPGTQSVFVSVSRNNGKTYTDPVQLNSAPSPPPDPAQFAEDDVSWVAVTTQYVFGVWGTGDLPQGIPWTRLQTCRHPAK